ncbi:MAG: tRNA preQ1(34) S-adenosylmethionine ribosyltransferase-isomerase QueA [Hyphomicrobiales bacterium]|jgi:S-adenosylmethionine:tRNA ribosyltransferase-isomerase
MRVDAFDFDLPEERIALYPADPRDSARLLHVGADGAFADHIVRDLPSLLQPGDLLVLNQTRVIPAQLAGVRTREGAEVLPVSVTLVEAQDREQLHWKAMARPGKRIKPGDTLSFPADGPTTLSCLVQSKGEDGLIALAFDGSAQSFADALHAVGMPPLPPYIAAKRGYHEDDKHDYQTVYAQTEGSVAAPTAGLHFTDDLFAALEKHGVGRAFVTLHVGMGTFLPVKADDTENHTMHAEWGEITPQVAEQINAARAAGGRVIAVGTTSLRILESAATDDLTVKPFQGATDIFITPGYQFKAIDALMTNFHLPRSTLFMLVSALCGLERMRAAYAHAITNQYRFYSYGDGSLLWKANTEKAKA